MKNRSAVVEKLTSRLELFIRGKTMACFSSRGTCTKDNELFIIVVIAEITDEEHFFKIAVGRGSSLQYVEFKECRILLTCVLETRRNSSNLIPLKHADSSKFTEEELVSKDW